ncbi:DUF2199 domain-containing protein [Actinomadura harenae]|uniref:DUF2199 domain-containing protein n=1 Tax=Actinomadura harenae TaxID=2483351 RepID=A0A3M2M4J0_9ACTN|nr:DUF2199 domain-containing protein [Actinomadura harenae]
MRERLEAYAPGATRGAELKGDSLLSPRGWAIAVAPPEHAGGHHYDVVAFPDVSVQPDVPCFRDCAVAVAGDPRQAADAWTQTAGACLLELVSAGDGDFAGRVGPSGEQGVPGWSSIISGVLGYGMDEGENERLQAALIEANVLHRIADALGPALESPFFNGVRIFYGGAPGSMTCEVRVNGEYDEAASAAMAALGLPEPTAFTVVRLFALLLPASADDTDDTDDHHGHSCGCSCGGHLDPEHPGFEISEPHLLAELSPEERARRIRTDTDVLKIAKDVGNFLKVRLPIRLDDGRTVVYLLWVYLRAEVADELVRRVNDSDIEGFRFEGLLCNTVEPWGEDVLRAPVVLGGQRVNPDGSLRYSEILESSDPLLSRILTETWPAEDVLGDRDPRLRTP